MPVDYEILREERVFVFTFHETFTKKEITDIIDFLRSEILDKATRKVFTICDGTQITRLPPNILSIILSLTKITHPMAGFSIVVSPSAFLNQMSMILSKVAPPDSIIVYKTMSDALAHVDRVLAKEVAVTILEARTNLPV